MEADQTDIDHVSRDAGDLYAIAHTNPIASDEEEVAGDRQDYVLQGNGNAGSDESGKCRQRSNLGSEGKGNGDADYEPENNSAQQKKLISAAKVMHVAKGCSLPDFSQDKKCDYHESEHEQANAQVLQVKLILRFHRATPACKTALIEV